MKRATANFRGEVPRLSPRALPDGMSQQAINCRLLSADLTCWKNFQEIEALCKGNDVNTIYPMRDPSNSSIIHWLHWTDNELADDAVCVDVAKSTIAGDTTGRVYLTGLDIPRYTNIALATQGGSGCLPHQTRPLGVIAPDDAPSLFVEPSGSAAIDVIDDFTTDTGWTFSPEINSGSHVSIAHRIDTGGNPGGCIEFEVNDTGANLIASASRDFSAGGSATVTVNHDVQLVQGTTSDEELFFWRIGNSTTAGGAPGDVMVGIYTTAPATFSLQLSVGGSTLSSVPCAGITSGVWYGVQIDVTRISSIQANVRFRLFAGSATIIDQTFSSVPVQGGCYGWQTINVFPDRNIVVWRVDNFHLVASAPAGDTTAATATSYVVTFVNDIGEESAPSPASATIIRDDGTAVTVTTQTHQPSGIDYFVTNKRIYRAASGSSGTAFLFVAEIPLSQADYIDTLTNAQLGEQLPSDNWDLPPIDLRGILALPNNIYCGFSGNQLCLSAQGFPHAWPVEFRLSTDQPIVALGAIDATVVAMTQGFTYLATGTTPANYAMTKLELPQGCVSKRGVAYIKDLGVIFPSPDGLVAVSGTGRMAVITEELFSRLEWQAIDPTTLISTAHDDRYFGFYDNGTPEGLMIEAKQGGFGKVTLGFHASAVLSDLLTDKLYLVLDANNPPVVSGSDNQVVPNGSVLYAFDSYEGGSPALTPFLPSSWLSKLEQLEYPAEFQYAQLKALDYGNATVIFIADGVSYFSKEVTSVKEFRLPHIKAATTYEVQIVGDGSQQNIASMLQYAEDVDELQ